MKKYKMNFSTKTLTISKEFAASALVPNSEEANLLIHLQNIIPDLKVKNATHKSPEKPNRAKGMTYKKMESYIRLYENSSELLVRFEMVKALSQIQPNPYNFVFTWFIKQFPKYKEMPEFVNGKLFAPIVEVPEGVDFKKVA